MGEHVMHIGQGFLDGKWHTSCSCGWEGTGVHKTTVDAADEWDNHCDVVFMEATMQGGED
jgi:hypothetical protein